ncbi:MAG: patatin family protein [Lachnospiraceae bacterium]|nr:patatin family protein [Lachnospiraceae bacterium]
MSDNEHGKTGLVMEGGGLRGIFTAGVIDVFLENNIEFDCAIGVSAGAAFGCNYKSGQKGRALRYNLAYCDDPRYCSFRSLIKTGDLFGAKFCYQTIPKELDLFDYEAYDKSPMDFYVVCTDMNTGQPVYHKCNKADDECFEWVRASASMPLVSKAVCLDGMQLLDGGISDSIPLEFMNKSGYRKNIVILTQTRDYIKEKNSTIPLMKLMYRKYPKLIEAVKNRHLIYNKQREYVFEQERCGNAFIICPKEPIIAGRVEHDRQKIQASYDMGRDTALKQLEAVKEFMRGNLYGK